MPMAIGSAVSPARTERRGEQRTLKNDGRGKERFPEGRRSGRSEETSRGGRRRTRRAARHCSRPLARDSWLLRPGWPLASITSDTSARSPLLSPPHPRPYPPTSASPRDDHPRPVTSYQHRRTASRASILGSFLREPITDMYNRLILPINPDD